MPSVAASGCSTWLTAPESVAALVHIRTTLRVRHAFAPQAGVRGLVTVSSIDVAFTSGGAQVGWATQAPPQGGVPLVISNGNTDLTAVAGNIYLYGRWAPHCQVLRVYWLPGDYSSASPAHATRPSRPGRGNHAVPIRYATPEERSQQPRKERTASHPAALAAQRRADTPPGRAHK